jgi:hypothetical protein
MRRDQCIYRDVFYWHNEPFLLAVVKPLDILICRHRVEKGEIAIKYMNTNDMLADMLAKFREMRNKVLGVEPPSDLNWCVGRNVLLEYVSAPCMRELLLYSYYTILIYRCKRTHFTYDHTDYAE